MERKKDDNLPSETNLSTSADKGSELIHEITGAVLSIEIRATNIFPNRHWSRDVIHGIPSAIGNKITVQLSTTIATKIENVTGFSLAQPPIWLSNPDDITRRGSGTIIVSLQGKVASSSLTILRLFNQHCRMEKARPDYCTAQCHKCQKFGHHQETCTSAAACGICADPHLTT